MNTLTKVTGGLLCAALLFSGCSEEATSTSSVSGVKLAAAPAEKPVVKEVVVEASAPVFEMIDLGTTFKDSAKIGPEGKPMVLVFDRPECKYCNKLKQDIAANAELQKRLDQDFSSYSLNATQNKMHKILHEGNFMDVDTKTMVDIYGVTSTPTIMFCDKAGKSIFVVPGYMPQEQFLATLDFVEDGLWLDKDRKNGEVYEVLRDYYVSKGIEVKSK